MKYAYSSLIIATVLLSGCESTMQNLVDSTKNIAESTQGAMGSLASAQKTEYEEKLANLTKDMTIHASLSSQDPLLAAYGTSVILTFTAHEYWLEAIGKDEAAAKLRTERIALENGAVIDRDSIARHVEMSVESEKLLNESKITEAELNDETKALFTKGLYPGGLGVLQARKVFMGAGDYYDYVTKGSITLDNVNNKIEKGSVFGYLLYNGWDFVSAHANSLYYIYNYCKEKNLEIPAETENVLDGFEI